MNARELALKLFEVNVGIQWTGGKLKSLGSFTLSAPDTVCVRQGDVNCRICRLTQKNSAPAIGVTNSGPLDL